MNSYIGADIFESFQGMLTGNVGFFLGLLLVVMGLLTLAFKKQPGAALIMIIGGVLITLSPGVFNATRKLVADVLGTVGGGQTTSGFQTGPGY